MNRRDDPFFSSKPYYEAPPASMEFPSQSRTLGRSHSAIPFHEEHHEDSYPVDYGGRQSGGVNFPSSYRRDGGGALLDDAVAHSLERERTLASTPLTNSSALGRRTPTFSSTDLGFGYQDRPSLTRAHTFGNETPMEPPRLTPAAIRGDTRPASAQSGQNGGWLPVPASGSGLAPQFNNGGPAHSFGQHLRERSPSSSSALLSLLNRYPSARQNIFLTAPRLYPAQDRPTATNSLYPKEQNQQGFPLVEVSVPRPTHRTSSLPQNNADHLATPEQPFLSTSFHEFSANPLTSTPAPYFDSYNEPSVPTRFDSLRKNPQTIRPEPVTYQETVTTRTSNSGEPTVIDSRISADYGNGPRTFYERTLLENGRQIPIARTTVEQSFQPQVSRELPVPFESQGINLRNNPPFRDPRDLHNRQFDIRQPPAEARPVRENFGPLNDFIPYRDPFDANTGTNRDDVLNNHDFNLSTLDAFVDDVLRDIDMSRSTNQWRNSFAQMQERFKAKDDSSTSPPSFYNNGSMTLPRGKSSSILTKSNSSSDMRNNNGEPTFNGPERRAAEAPEFRKSPQLTSYWENTLKHHTPTVSIPIQKPNLTAAERLQLLHEDPNSPAPQAPRRIGSGEALAARKAQYQIEVQKVEPPPAPAFNMPISKPVRRETSGGGPNFAALEEAVHELSGVRRTGYSEGARRSGGCARFPTEEFALSPPRQRDRPMIHSPSPDAISESSSIYQMPSGLPHPKPKHNIKEQIYYAGLQQNTLPRSGLRTSPNFPVPSTGSVTSRITEFEKRPGTPTLSIGGLKCIPQEQEPISPGPLSPRNTVFRSKPVIHIEMGSTGRSTPIPSVFDFPTPEPQNTSPLKSSPYMPSPTRDERQTNIDLSPNTLANHTDENHALTKVQSKVNGIKPLSFDDSLDSTAGSDVHRGILENTQMTGSIYEPADRILTPRSVRKQLRDQGKDVAPFFFPQGKPVSKVENDATLRRALDMFRKLPGQKASFADIDSVLKAAGLPLYWKRPIYDCLTGKKDIDVSPTEFSSWFRNMTSVAHDEAARFVYTVTAGKRDYIEKSDLEPLCYDLIWSHPGLGFYHKAVEFHSKYVEIVVTRIYWNVNRSWSGKITAAELRKSDFLEQLRFLEREDDINKETHYFSYEHFYVIYCKFWDIDQDHDMLISQQDMMQHDEGALTNLAIDRIFSKAVCRGARGQEKLEQIGLAEFTAFLMADEDKKNPTSVEYWFRICDLDGDGLISLFEMETMYDQVKHKLESSGFDTMGFNDVACNLIDMIRPTNKNGFSLTDLKKCPLAYRFFNSFVNYRKFYNQEVNEGEKPSVRNDEGRELSEWEKYCAEEYESLMEMEEQVDESHSVNLDDEDSHNSFRDLL